MPPVKTTKTTTKPQPTTSAAPPAAVGEAIAVRPKAELVKVNLAALAEEDAGAGSEDVSRADLAIPRVGLLQGNSPQVKKSEGAYIKGAEEGDFLDSVTSSIMAKGDTGFLFIPAHYSRHNIEWIPRTKGGGFVADHGPDDAIFSQTTKDEETGGMMLSNGNEVVTTGEFVGILCNPDGSDPRAVAISLAKSQLKKSRKLNTLLTTLQVPRSNGQGTFNPAFFFSYFVVTSVPETSKKSGDSYMGWSFVRKGDTLSLDNGQDLYLMARGLRESLTAGTIKVSQHNETSNAVPESDDSAL